MLEGEQWAHIDGGGGQRKAGVLIVAAALGQYRSLSIRHDEDDDGSCSSTPSSTKNGKQSEGSDS